MTSNKKLWIRAALAIFYIGLGTAIFIRIISDQRTLLDPTLFVLFAIPALARVDKIFLGE